KKASTSSTCQCSSCTAGKAPTTSNELSCFSTTSTPSEGPARQPCGTWPEPPQFDSTSKPTASTGLTTPTDPCRCSSPTGTGKTRRARLCQSSTTPARTHNETSSAKRSSSTSTACSSGAQPA